MVHQEQWELIFLKNTCIDWLCHYKQGSNTNYGNSLWISLTLIRCVFFLSKKGEKRCLINVMFAECGCSLLWGETIKGEKLFDFLSCEHNDVVSYVIRYPELESSLLSQYQVLVLSLWSLCIKYWFQVWGGVAWMVLKMQKNGKWLVLWLAIEGENHQILLYS